MYNKNYGKKDHSFVLFLSLMFGIFIVPKVYADFDCLTLSTSSSQSDKDYCRMN